MSNVFFKSLIGELLINPIENALKRNVANFIYADDYDTENIKITTSYDYIEEDTIVNFKIAAKVCVELGKTLAVVLEGTIYEGDVTLCEIHYNSKRYVCYYDEDDKIELK